MKLKFAPTLTLNNSTVIEVMDENTLRYDSEAYYFDPSVVEYQSAPPILAAHRDEAGELFVRVHVFYTDATWEVWQTPDAQGNRRGHDYEEHGVGVVLALPPPQVEEAVR